MAPNPVPNPETQNSATSGGPAHRGSDTAHRGSDTTSPSSESAADPRSELLAAGRMWAGAHREVVRVSVRLDRSKDWALDGARSCAQWVASALDIEMSTAREWLRVGRLLEQLPLIADAFYSGQLSYSKVRQLTRVATPDIQSDLLRIAEHTPAGKLSRVIAAWLVRNEEPEETEERQNRSRSLSWYVEPDGMVRLTARLTPEMAAMPMAAIDAWIMQRDTTGIEEGGLAGRSGSRELGLDASADASGTSRFGKRRRLKWPTMAQQRADGLVALMQQGGALVNTEIVLHVRGDGCALDDGTPITQSFVEDLVPRSFIRVLIHDAERRPINASGRHRFPTTRQKRVVHERDRGCVDCGSVTLLETDHEPDFSITHRTVVDELRDRCWSCHRLRHAQQRSSGPDEETPDSA